MAVIDAHVHVHAQDNPLPNIDLMTKDWAAPAEQLISRMDANGVDHAVLVPVTGDTANHRYIAECVERYSDRFVGTGVLPSLSEKDVDQFLDEAERYELRGVRAFSIEGWDSQPAAGKFLANLQENGRVLSLYCPEACFGELALVTDRYPALNIVLNLLGFPWPGSLDDIVKDEHGRPTVHSDIPPQSHESMLQLSEVSNVFVQFGAHFQFSRERHPHLDLRDISQDILTAFGARRMLWMTDWPWIDQEPGYALTTTIVDSHLSSLDAAERAAVMGGTAARLYGFG